MLNVNGTILVGCGFRLLNKKTRDTATLSPLLPFLSSCNGTSAISSYNDASVIGWGPV